MARRRRGCLPARSQAPLRTRCRTTRPRLVVAGSTLLWAYGGSLADPGSVLADYVENWRTGRVEVARAQFDAPPDPVALSEGWHRQLAALRNDLVRVSAVAGPGARIDPDDPLDTVVWLPAEANDADTSAFDIAVVRTESVRGQLFGLLPSTAQRVELLERFGRVELRRVDPPGQVAGQMWRITSVDVDGISVGTTRTGAAVHSQLLTMVLSRF
jgi:hypothetical protein